MDFSTVQVFEKKIAKYAGSKYAVSVDCCSDALYLCLKYESPEIKLSDSLIEKVQFLENRPSKRRNCIFLVSGGREGLPRRNRCFRRDVC